MHALATNLSAHKCLLVEDQPRTRDWLHGALTSAFPGISIVTAVLSHKHGVSELSIETVG